MANTRRAPFISHATSNDLTPIQITHNASGSGSGSGSMVNGNGGYYGVNINGGPSIGGAGVGNGKGKEVAGRANGHAHGGYASNSGATSTTSAYGPSAAGRRPSIHQPTPLPFSHNANSYSLPGGHSRRTDLTSPRPPSNQPAFQTTISRLLSSPLPSPSTMKFMFLCTLWYGTSALSSNTGKVILNNFRFPVTLTIVQFFFVAGYCWLFTEGRKVFGRTVGLLLNRVMGARTLTGGGSGLVGGGLRLRSPTRAILGSTWPMAMFQVGGHIFASMAMSRVKVSTVHTIKALSPLFTVLAYVFLFGVSYSPATYISLLPLTLGVMLASSADMSASNALGLICAFGSTLVFVSQNIVFKKIMPSPTAAHNANGNSAGASVGGLSTATAGSGKLDKINLLFYSSGMAFMFMIPVWAFTDMHLLVGAWMYPEVYHLPAAKITPGPAPNVLFYFFLNGTVHFAQNLLAFAILSSTSPVTYSIASLVKRIAVILLAIVWFSQKVHPVQWLGIGLTAVGLWMYNSAKKDVEKGEKKVRRLEAVKEGMLPLTRADQRLLDERSEANTPDLMNEKHMHASPKPEYAYGDYAMPPISHTSAIRNNGFALPSATYSAGQDENKHSRGTPQGYVVPYPSVSQALPSPPPSTNSSPPFVAMPPTQLQDIPSNYPTSGTARRRASNEHASKASMSMGKGMNEGRGHGHSINEGAEEILVDLDSLGSRLGGRAGTAVAAGGA